MQRSVSFGLGITLMLIGLAISYYIHSIDPGDNTPAAMLIGAVMIFPGSILLGRAIWPPQER